MVESSDKTWSIGEGNGKPLQYYCLENPMTSRKRHVATAESSKFAGILSAATSPPGPIPRGRALPGLLSTATAAVTHAHTRAHQGQHCSKAPAQSIQLLCNSGQVFNEMNSTNFPLFLFSLNLPSWILDENKECSCLVCLPSGRWSDVLS